MSSAPPTRMSHRLWEKTQPWHTPDSASNNRHNSSITFPSSSRAKQRGLVIKLVVRVQNFQPAFRPIDNTDTERERERERERVGKNLWTAFPYCASENQLCFDHFLLFHHRSSIFDDRSFLPSFSLSSKDLFFERFEG